MPEGRRLHLLGFVLSVAAVGVAYASAFPAGPPAWAAWVMAGGIAGALVSMMALGAARHGRVGLLAYPFAFVFVVLAGGFGTALALPGPSASNLELWFGLPTGAAVILYGVGLLPLLVIPLAYALTFDHFTLQEEDWERVRSFRPEGARSEEGREGEGAGREGEGEGREGRGDGSFGRPA